MAVITLSAQNLAVISPDTQLAKRICFIALHDSVASEQSHVDMLTRKD
jgi:hypothetical protein